ncbi:AAA family ATPase [Roseococcus sp.]|uniref:AAA family ATPase n=1 Tax=Roseococcus sp. TaxID=2109646 RepID=UPI003BA8B7B3
MNAIKTLSSVKRERPNLPVALLLTLDVSVVDRLSAALAGLAQVHRADPIEDAAQLSLAELRPQLLVVDAEEAGEGLGLLMTTLRRGAPGAAIVALGDEHAADLILSCMRAGALDFVGRQSGEVALRRVLRARLERGTREVMPDRQGPAFALFGARPGDPSRALALSLAVQRARTGAQVLFLDLAVGNRETEIMLDISPGYGVPEALEDLDRLDQTLLTSAVPKHAESGLSVMLLGEARSLDALAPADISALLVLLRGVYDEVIVHGTGATLIAMPGLIAGLRRFALVASQSLASAQAAAEALRRLREIGIAAESRIVLVVAEHDARILPAPATLAGSIGVSHSLAVSDNRVRLANAANQGRFAEDALADRGYAKQIAAMAVELGAERDAAKKPSLLQRLLGTGA